MKISTTRTVSIAVFTMSATAATSSGTVILGPIVNPANDHSYYLLEADDWTASEAEAVLLGGHLTAINDQAEQDWVWSTFGEPSNRFLWIGLFDAASEGEFVWTNGDPLTYTNWTPGEPNDANAGEDYVEMDASRGGEWNDLSDVGQGFQYGVVEVVPEPTTVMLFGLGCVLTISKRGRK